MHNSLGSPRRPVLWTYWPETCALRECVCKRKRLRDVRSYAICDFHRGPHAVRGLLLANDAGGGGATTRFRGGGCRGGGCKPRGPVAPASQPAPPATPNAPGQMQRLHTLPRAPPL